MSLGATASRSAARGRTETVKPQVIWNGTALKMGILGSLRIATLGGHWARAGHVIFFSYGHPMDLQELVKEADLRIRKA